MPIDLARARADTPGVQHVHHFNSAGAALMPTQVLDAVVEHLRAEATIGGYEAANAAASRLDAAYPTLARLLNAAPEEIAVIENATRAWDMAFYALPLGQGDRVLTAEAEYSSNVIAFLHQAKRRGCVIEPVPSDESGTIDLDALARALDDRRHGRVGLVAVTHIPTNGGLVNPAEAIGRLTRAAGAPYLLDACQSVGQMPVDVQAIGCDMLSGTGRKFLRGPRGTGFLYVRRDFLDRLDPPFLDNHAARWIERDRYEIRPDARRFENWESFVAGKLGLTVAAEYAMGWGLEAIRDRIWALAHQLRSGIRAIPGARVTDVGREQCGIVSFTLPGIEPPAIKAALLADKVNVTTSSIFSTRWDMERRGLDLVVRASLHYYNTEEEVDALLARLARLAGH